MAPADLGPLVAGNSAKVDGALPALLTPDVVALACAAVDGDVFVLAEETRGEAELRANYGAALGPRGPAAWFERCFLRIRAATGDAAADFVCRRLAPGTERAALGARLLGPEGFPPGEPGATIRALGSARACGAAGGGAPGSARACGAAGGAAASELPAPRRRVTESDDGTDHSPGGTLFVPTRVYVAGDRWARFVETHRVVAGVYEMAAAARGGLPALCAGPGGRAAGGLRLLMGGPSRDAPPARMAPARMAPVGAPGEPVGEPVGAPGAPGGAPGEPVGAPGAPGGAPGAPGGALARLEALENAMFAIQIEAAALRQELSANQAPANPDPNSQGRVAASIWDMPADAPGAQPGA
jgi:hypothetical protein